MKRKLAFVLAGGGSRGALQAGALRALLEAGIVPDLAAGTSIGAANIAFLGVHGWTPEGARRLEQVWLSTASQDLLPDNLWWQAMRAFFRRSQGYSQQRIRDFAIASGLAPSLRFRDLPGPRLFLVASDLNAGCPVVFGEDPDDSVLDSVLASMTLPPWIAPRRFEDRYLVDGAVVSNLPIETALQQGAEEIIALDLYEPKDSNAAARGLRPFLVKLNQTVELRTARLELELAEAKGVPVHHLNLTSEPPVAIWDFRRSPELLERGCTLAEQSIADCTALESWQHQEDASWRRLFHLPARLEHRIQVRKSEER